MATPFTFTVRLGAIGAEVIQPGKSGALPARFRGGRTRSDLDSDTGASSDACQALVKQAFFVRRRFKPSSD